MNDIRRRLTLSYSAWFFITLIVVLALVYFFMKMSVYDEVKKEMYAYLHHEQQAVLSGNHHDSSSNFEDRLERPFGFFDVFIPTGKKPSVHEADTGSYRDAILRQHPESQNHVILTELTLKGRKDVHVALISRTISKNHHRIGTLYVGKNISREHARIQHWLFVLIAIAIALFLISVFVGDWLAKRAMVPILDNIERQKKFVADASHELKTPMSILQSSLEVVKRDRGNTFSDFSRKIFGDMNEEIKHMDRLAGHLLTMASYNAGYLPVSDEIFPIDKCVSSVVRRFQVLVKRSERELLFDRNSVETWLVSADPTRIEQLLYVLLENAIKFTDENGRIQVQLQKRPERVVRIMVNDDGIGVPAAERERIFDPFYRAKKTRSHSYEGSGLGLSIVQAIVQVYNGSIHLKSEVGRGSTFTIDLPILIE